LRKAREDLLPIIFTPEERAYLERLARSPKLKDKKLCLDYLEWSWHLPRNRTFAVRLLDGLVPHPHHDVRWRALIMINFQRDELPELAWSLVAKHGCSRSDDLRVAVAVCTLEHLLDENPGRWLPRIRRLLLTGGPEGKRFVDTLRGSYLLCTDSTIAAAERIVKEAVQRAGKAWADIHLRLPPMRDQCLEYLRSFHLTPKEKARLASLAQSRNLQDRLRCIQCLDQIWDLPRNQAWAVPLLHRLARDRNPKVRPWAVLAVGSSRGVHSRGAHKVFWTFASRYGPAASPRQRGKIGLFLLQPLLAYHFKTYLPKVKHVLSAGGPRGRAFRDMLRHVLKNPSVLPTRDEAQQFEAIGKLIGEPAKRTPTRA
jgi:hypothetical protein